MADANQQIDKSLALTEEIINLLAANVKDYSIFVMDQDGIIISWNDGAEKMTGYAAKDVINFPFATLYPHDPESRLHASFVLNMARDKGVYTEEGIRYRKDGTTYFASVILNAIYDNEGTLRGFVKIMQDVTERKQQEQKLRESEEKSRLLIEAVKDYAIFRLDSEGHIVSWNTGAQRINGYREEEILGKHFSIFYPESLIQINHPQRELELAVEFGRYEEEGIRIRKDGSEFHADVVITPLYDDAGKLRGFAKVTRDITDRKLAEQKLKRTNEELEWRVAERTQELQTAKDSAEAANRAKSAFLANMSHEIRTPLGAVTGFSEMLTQTHLSDEMQQKCREAIVRNSNLLIAIVDDILDLSKIEAGQLKINRSEIKLSDLIDDVESFFKMRARDRGLNFSIQCDDDLPEYIFTDPVRLKQILFNIIGNAIKFTEHGRVTVTVQTLKTSELGKIIFEVEDTGPGIDDQSAKKLFQPFSQVDTSLTRKHGGTGLGLALSRQLARALHGDIILAHSEPGKGSVFTISIGTAKSLRLAESTEKLESVPLLDASAYNELSPTLEGLRVLLVEDSDDNRVLIQTYLRDAGAIVVCANNGREGVELVRRSEVDIILMDISMPIMDGYEAARYLRKIGYKKLIVAITAHVMDEARQDIMAAGFDDHVFKPIDRAGLVSRIAEITNSSTAFKNFSSIGT